MGNHRKYGMCSDRKSQIDMSDLRYFGILFQGVVVAVTIFLGRIYVLAYYETLGVPVYESQLSAIDYAIVSPGVTVMGIGLSIILGSYLLLFGPLARLQLSISFKRGLAWFLIVAGLVTLIVLPYIDIDSVIHSLCIVLSMAMSGYGGAMLGSATTTKAKRDDLRSEQKLVEEAGFLRLFLGVAAIVLVVVYGTFAYTFSSSTARDDAMDALHQSPQTTVRFASGDSGSFRVIMIGEHFVYLMPEESEDLRAVPLNSIEKVDYAKRAESNAQ